MDRSERNGIRCALYPDWEKLNDSLFQKVRDVKPPDYYKIKPVSDTVFSVYKEQFAYDRTSLNSRVESRKDNPEGWIWETITFNAAYGGERIIVHLFLPKNTMPPYQTVIYFPGGGSLYQDSSGNMENYYEFPMFLSFLVKNGRAVLYPVYKGTFERSDPVLFEIIDRVTDSRSYTELMIQLVKDFKRCIDYLETRQDIDTGRLAFYGMSWGATLGAIIPAVDKRLKASVLLGGGISGEGRSEVNQVNYVSRVKIPTLMLNGNYDMRLPLNTSAKPMFELLGTPAKHKQIKVYETDHFIPRNDYIKETVAWLDQYLGPVIK